MSRSKLRPLLVLLVLGLLTAIALGVSGGIASSSLPAAPTSAGSAFRPAAATETVPECLARLRKFVKAVADLDRLADDVRDGKFFLIRKTQRLYVSVERHDYENWITLEVAIGSFPVETLTEARRSAERETRANLRRLDSQLDNAHQRVRALEKKCEQLKQAQAGGGGGGSSSVLKLTITFEGAEQTRDLKTNALASPPNTPKTTANVQSGQTYGGDTKVEGTLPGGYVVYVYHGPQAVLYIGPGGHFSGVTEPKGFGASTDVSAYACPTGGRIGGPLPSTCLGEGAQIAVKWKP